MNAIGFRSSSIFTIHVEQRDVDSGKMGLRSLVRIVDLSGELSANFQFIKWYYSEGVRFYVRP